VSEAVVAATDDDGVVGLGHENGHHIRWICTR
jgi:hypothetical protein